VPGCKLEIRDWLTIHVDLKRLDEVTITADAIRGDFIIGIEAEVFFLIEVVNGTLVHDKNHKSLIISKVC